MNSSSTVEHLSSHVKANVGKSVDSLNQTLLNLQLLRAVHRRDVFGEDGVLSWIKKGALIQALDDQGESPIRAALSMKVASEIHFPMVKVLCENGADVTQADVHGWTPLMHVVKSGAMSLVMLIYKYGNRADLGRVNNTKESCLHIACHIRSYEIVRFLCARMSKFGLTRTNINGKTPFIIASQNGSTEILKVLRKVDGRDETLLKQDGRGWTCLHWAIFSAHVEVLRILYKWGVPDLSEEETSRLERLGNDRAASYAQSGTIYMAAERETAAKYMRKRRLMKQRKKELFDLPPDLPLDTDEAEAEAKIPPPKDNLGVAYQRRRRK